ncbi:MAG: toll/interleukin-1 receptor domain-containing protein [Thiobacillus sp.]
MPHEVSPPKVFLSYSWEGDAHKEWVRALAERLTQNGVNVRLDQWHTSPGQSLTQFMETEVQTCEFVLVVCTKDYCRKSLARVGGVGYEQQIITGNIVAGTLREHFIPIVRDGEFAPGAECSIPPQFMGVYAVDMRDGVDPDQSIEILLRAIYRQPAATQPPIGMRPVFANGLAIDTEAENSEVEELRLPVLEIDGWHLRSGVASHHQWPETFDIPEENERRGLVNGDIVKLQFEIALPDKDEPFGERMWVMVRGKSGPYFIGELNNIPATSDEQDHLVVGDRVVFLPEHVISIYTHDGLEIQIEDNA